MSTPPKVPPSGYFTHYPQSSGTVCGVYPAPSNAAHYDPESPTCPKCAKWLRDVRESTAARFGRTDPGRTETLGRGKPTAARKPPEGEEISPTDPSRTEQLATRKPEDEP